MRVHCLGSSRPLSSPTLRHPRHEDARLLRAGPVFFINLCPIFAAETLPRTTPGLELPNEWEAADIRPVRKPGFVRHAAAAKSFTIRSIGEATEMRGTFGYAREKGDSVASCRMTAASAKSMGAGLMVRTGTESGAHFLKNASNGVRFGNDPAVTVHQTDHVAAWQPGDITHVQPLPCWVRVIRCHDSIASYYSADGQEWNLMHFGGARFSPGLPDEVRVGGVNSQHDSDELEQATIDNVSIEQPVTLPYVTSRLGNSFASQYGQGHVPMEIGAMCIQPGVRPLRRITGQNAALDRLFVGGFTAERRKAGSDHGGSVGAVRMGFAEVRGRKGSGRRLWQCDLPYEAGTEGLGKTLWSHIRPPTVSPLGPRHCRLSNHACALAERLHPRRRADRSQRRCCRQPA